MVFKQIERIKKLPKDVRKTYALFIAGAITVVIVCIYFIALFLGALGTRTPKGDGISTGDAIRNEIDTLKELFDSSNVFKDDTQTGDGSQSGSWAEELKNLEATYDWDEIPLENESSSSTESYEGFGTSTQNTATSTVATTTLMQTLHSIEGTPTRNPPGVAP